MESACYHFAYSNFPHRVSHVKKIIPILLFGLVAAASLPTYATPTSTTIKLGTIFTGTTPSGSAPWLTATFTFDTDSPNAGTLTLTSQLNSSDFVGGPNIGWGFHLNTGISSIACSGGNCADNVLSAGNYNAGPLKKDWNLGFEWLAGDRLVSGNSAIYDITFSNALAGSLFGTNTDPNDKVGGWLSVAHVQGISAAGCSGWIVAGAGQGAQGDDGKCTRPTITNVPEPSVLGMFGFGALMIGLFVGRRRRLQQGHDSSSF
jgi:hypothetical protein